MLILPEESRDLQKSPTLRKIFLNAVREFRKNARKIAKELETPEDEVEPEVQNLMTDTNELLKTIKGMYKADSKQKSLKPRK